MAKSDLVDIEVAFRYQTPSAYLVEGDHGEVWVPKSACELSLESPRPGQIVTITLAEHVAIEKRLV